MIRTIALLVLLAASACSPPAENAPARPPVVRTIAEAARAEMNRINAANEIALRTRPEAAADTGAPQAVAEEDAAEPAVVDPSVSYDAGLVRLQVLLDRAHFSPGVIDGYDGDNVRKAVSEYQAQNGLDVTGVADAAMLLALAARDTAPALVAYVIAEEDVAGPFVEIPEDLEAMSRLDHLGYASAAEGLAEKFHMDEDLLRLLNPGVDFNQQGVEIVVANPGGALAAQVASIEVDKGSEAVRAYDSTGAIVAFYPATIGSEEAPAPSGQHAVRGIAFDPTYRYDPERLPTFGDRDHGALTIAAGPNNPVGAVWIALTAETYGIHGAPDPSKVSKTQSHGCVRLTNWDAVELARAVSAGTPVVFVDQTTRTAPVVADRSGSQSGSNRR